MDCKLNDEDGRIAALERYAILDSGREEAFDKITSLVKTIFDVPICAVSLIDRDRQWFKSIQGLDAVQSERSVAFCDHTIRSREPLLVTDASKDERFMHNPAVTGEPHLACYLGIPLASPDGYNLGSLCVADCRPRKFTAEKIQVLQSFAALVVAELELRMRAQQDFLTGAATRRAFVEQAEREIERCGRYDRQASIIVFDIDHFKRVNDNFGHPAGDQVLKAVVTGCAAALRSHDFIGRLGGEEFAILLPETGADQAMVLAQRLRSAIEGLDVGLGERRVTASFGIASLGFGTEAVDGWLAAADAALYAAKQGGRNRCISAESLVEQAA